MLILTSSWKAPITASFSWSRQLFILSRRFLSISGFLICQGTIRTTGIRQRGGHGARRLGPKAKLGLCASTTRYLPLFFSAGVFAGVVLHGGSSHVGNRPSARPLLRVLCASLGASARRGPLIYQPPLACECPSLWSWHFPTHGFLSVKADRSLPPFTTPQKEIRGRQMSGLTASGPLHPPLHPRLRTAWLPHMSQK